MDVAINRLLYKLQSAESNGPFPQSRLKMGWYETMLNKCNIPLFSATINLETSSGCHETAMTADL